MGVKVLKIGAKREALALVCDCPAHVDGARTAWFDCGSQSGNVSLAKAAGWTEGYGGPRRLAVPSMRAGERAEAENATKRKRRISSGGTLSTSMPEAPRS